jgi:hypothetical protein|nr:hypothetical protein [uncultured Acetatifactor sp.]
MGFKLFSIHYANGFVLCYTVVQKQTALLQIGGIAMKRKYALAAVLVGALVLIR